MHHTHLRNLQYQARQFVATIGRIPYDHVVKMMNAGLDAITIENNLLKELNR